MNQDKKRGFIVTLIILIALLFPAKVRGEGLEVGALQTESHIIEPGKAGAVSDPQQEEIGPTDPAELEAFLDELIGKQLAGRHIAGAVVSVVKDGELFFVKGYGYADLENKIPVDPDQTVFAICSLGKTFTWTAVLHLVEQGKLDLDADVKTYLDFRIPDTYPQPITLKHLITHTSGFENRLLGSIVSDAKDVVPAREWLTSNMPTRVRTPGEKNA